MMNLTYHNENAMPHKIPSCKRYDNRIGFWADVVDVNSNNNTVTVINDQEWEIPDIRVAAKEWIVKEENKDFASTERNLPPIGARVFVLVPDGNIESALIICSGIPRKEPDVQGVWANVDESTEDGKKEIQRLNRIKEVISQGGWHIKENYDTGNYSIESAEEDIKLVVNPVQVEDEDTGEIKEYKTVKLTLWDNEIEISPVKDDEKGLEKKIQITLLENTITITDKGLVIEDINENKITTDDKGVLIDDTNGVEIKTSSSGIELYKDKDSKNSNYVKLGSKVSIKGASGTLEIT